MYVRSFSADAKPLQQYHLFLTYTIVVRLSRSITRAGNSVAMQCGQTCRFAWQAWTVFRSRSLKHAWLTTFFWLYLVNCKYSYWVLNIYFIEVECCVSVISHSVIHERRIVRWVNITIIYVFHLYVIDIKRKDIYKKIYCYYGFGLAWIKYLVIFQ